MTLEEEVTKLYEGAIMATDPGVALIKGELPLDGSVNGEEQLLLLAGAVTGLKNAVQLLAREIEGMRA